VRGNHDIIELESPDNFISIEPLACEAHSYLLQLGFFKTMSTGTYSTHTSRRVPSNYMPYGYRNAEKQPIGILGYNGEPLFTLRECYALGNGHRVYSPRLSPRLMRFISADTLSPFDRGGLNCYAYCLNDPINATDPSGKSRFKTAGTVALAAVKFKKNLSSRTENTNHWKALGNWYADELSEDVKLAIQSIKNQTTHITLVKNPASLFRLNDSQFKHKFVFTRDRNFFIGSYSADEPSHPSIAHLGQGITGTKSEVVSAGGIIKDGNGYTLDTHSGHYKPSVEQLKPAKAHLESLGIAVTSLRENTPSKGYAARL
jgi:RHS repeat-associated protein